MRTRTCGRCGAKFERNKRNPDRWCTKCEKATAEAELFALIFDDRSGLHSLHETFEAATEAMKADAATLGGELHVPGQGEGPERCPLRASPGRSQL